MSTPGLEPQLSVDFPVLHRKDVSELRLQARELGLADADRLRRPDLVFAVGEAVGAKHKQLFGRGVLEVHDDGFGFLRSSAANFLPGERDIYVSQSQIRRFKLQTGDTVIGLVRAPKEGERYPALLRVASINGEPPEDVHQSFDELTAIYPDDRIQLADDPLLRAVDLAAPMGLGQRGLLVSPARTGRVEILRSMASLLTADEDLHVTVLLVGERPEEIHEWRAETTAEIVATPFDEPPSRHVQVADIVFERARRMVERGDDAVLLVDSLTRLLRFCLADLPSSGRSIGGVDSTALHRIRRYLGAARALEEGGSLTVIGVVSGDLDNPMDRVLLDDLRDVVNWEVVLSRDLADRGIRPAIDPHRSGTRRQERLLSPAEIDRRHQFRQEMSGDLVDDALKLLSWSNSVDGKVLSDSLKRRPNTKVPPSVTPSPASSGRANPRRTAKG
jgi:transcription termination factor Rho